MFTDNPLVRPGFGLPIRYEVDPFDDGRFAHGVNDFHADRLVVRELAMLQVMEALTNKPSWRQKVFDDSIIDKWRREALTQKFMSERAWAWCLHEMRDKAKFYEKRGFITTLHPQAPCVKSDTLITPDIRDELLKGVEPLLNVRPARKDWHPNSNEMVLNLVHPSLHCLVYGKTRVLEDQQVNLENCIDYCGQGVVAAADQIVDQSRPENSSYRGREGSNYHHDKDEDMHFSKRFAWLPSEVKFKNAMGTDVEIISYINNLHPKDHCGLYHTIEKIISVAIPMWNECLVKDGTPDNSARITVTEAEVNPKEPPEWANDIDGDADPGDEGYNKWLPKVREYLSLPDDPGADFTKDDQSDREYLDGSWEGREYLYSAIEWKHQRIQRITHPEPGNEEAYESWWKHSGLGDPDNGTHEDELPVRLESDFREQGLQIITKLASIELTPDKPDYVGGSWHLEGLLNEHIVATAIYYYSTSNTTPSHLSFRVEAQLDNSDFEHEQDQHRPLATIFGTDSLRDEPAIQNIGSVATPENRLLVFPNTLQHRVEPFSLEDKSKSGHRRFLVLWLVDPHYRVLSTANVPPQQKDWWARETVEPLLRAKDVPPELDDMVVQECDGQMSLEEAKAYRLELMKERTKHMPSVERGFDTYNFCEH